LVINLAAEWLAQLKKGISNMSSGKDAHRPRDKAPAQPGDYGRNGSPSRPDKMSFVGGSKAVPGVGAGATRSWGRRADEIDRSRVSTAASVRTDFYTDRPRSEATGGPASDKSRKPVSYNEAKYGPET
jgi:hypothetical protein